MRVMPGMLTLRDILRMPEFFLGLATILVAVVGGATTAWRAVQGIPVLASAVIMGLSVLTSLGFLKARVLREVFALTPISAVMGIMLLVNSILTVVSYGPGTWVVWVGLVSASFSLYAAYLRLFPRTL
jgi:hypothetical protein